MKIQDYINDRNKYKVDRTYQRPADAWSSEDSQCLIDTIIKGEPMPLFFLNYVSGKGMFYIVDGQQRLNAIEKFYDNKLKLNKKYSGTSLHGKSFNGENSVNDETKKAFLEYNLQIKIMKDYNDERIRLIFSRLQRGKPLQLGEKLNACPGEIVQCMRDVANHNFLSKSVAVPKNRYGVFPDAARILFYEVYGARQCGTKELFGFFEEKYEINKKSKEFKNATTVLNYLEDCFSARPGNHDCFEKHAWVFAVYTMVRDLKMFYSLKGEGKTISKFIKSFHKLVYNEDFRTSNRLYQKYYESVRGGWTEKLIKFRRDALINEFLKQNKKLKELDIKRQLTDEEKLSVYSELSEEACERCAASFKSYKEPEYHHIERYIDGGKSRKGNIMVVCKECHKMLHGNPSIHLPSDSDINAYNSNDD